MNYPQLSTEAPKPAILLARVPAPAPHINPINPINPVDNSAGAGTHVPSGVGIPVQGSNIYITNLDISTIRTILEIIISVNGFPCISSTSRYYTSNKILGVPFSLANPLYI